MSARDAQQADSTPHRIWYEDVEEPITIAPPDHETLEQAFAEFPKEFHPDRSFVCELHDCTLVGESAIAIFQGDIVITETAGGRIHHSFLGPYWKFLGDTLSAQLFTRSRGSEEGVFPLVCPDPSYYHWMVEYLPKVRLLELYQDRTGQRPKILVDSDPPAYVYETLESAGYGSDRVVEWDQQETDVENLVVCSHRTHQFKYRYPAQSDYNPSRRDFIWLRNRMRSTIRQPDTDQASPRRIYVSRQEVTRGRRVINYDEILAVLERYDVEPYVLERYPFQKQLELLAEAETIVGPHGAGLLNAVFADDPTVVELFPETVVKPYFYYLAEMLDLDYSALVAGADGENLRVDVEELDEVLADAVRAEQVSR